MTLKKKAYQDLTFADDFMFCNIMQNNLDICKDLVELILDRKIGEIKFSEAQKALDIKLGQKGVRLDVYFEDDFDTLYNIEMQTVNRPNLPKRSRYYQGLIDLNQIRSGTDFRDLKRSYIVFICMFDFFNLDFPVYEFEPRCTRKPDLRLNDETSRVFVNATSTENTMSNDLKSFLTYLTKGVADSMLTRKIDEEVRRGKENEMWELSYMKSIEHDRENFNDGFNEGFTKGQAEGHAEGHAEGQAEIIKRLYDSGMTIPVIAKAINESEKAVAEMLDSCKDEIIDERKK